MKTMLAIIALSLSASAANLTQEPASFAVARSDLQNQHAVLSWKLPTDVTNTVIYRAYGEGGPWTEIAETNDLATTYTDETAPLGVPCWYKIAFAARDEENVRTVGDMCAAVVTHRRCQLLERDWSNMTHVKDGVTVIWNAPYKTSWWNGGKNDSNQTISKPATAQASAELAFDNMRNSAPNIGYASAGTWHAVGVDLGSQFFVSFVRCHPRSDSAGNRAKINGMAIYGANGDIGNAFSTDWPAISDALTDYSTGWHEIPITNIAPYRYFYACNASDDNWRLMVGELQFYGWPATATDDYPIGAVGLTVVQANSSPVRLSWKDNGYGTTFNVERSADGGETWTTIASGLSATTYEDTDVVLGTDYRYRIASVSGDELSYSAAVRCVPYAHGDGEGLHRSAFFPFISTNATEMTEYVSTGAVSIAAATLAEARPIIDDVEGSHTNVYVTWTGKLIVPLNGTYRFRAVANGMVSVWINDANVTRYSAGSGLSELLGDSISLTAGEHNIRVAYWQGASASGCELYWSGAVAEEQIPVSQLKPVVPNALPGEWEGLRPFTSSATAFFPSDARVNADGTFDLAFTGADIQYTDGRVRGHNFLYRPFTGDFKMTVKMKMNASSWKSGEKGGLKVAANLTEASPFEAFLLRGNQTLGLRARRSSLSEPKSLDGKSTWATPYKSATIYMRLDRKGSVFTYYYRAAKTDPWTAIYTYDDSANGYYGDTVYIGPVATCVSIGSDGWGGDSYRTARYAWRFSEFDVHSPRGMNLILR